jgi:predicted ATPase
MAGARVQPVMLAFEDLHWTDPTTLDVLVGMAERGALAPLFVVATTRPEFRPPWGTAEMPTLPSDHIPLGRRCVFKSPAPS